MAMEFFFVSAVLLSTLSEADQAFEALEYAAAAELYEEVRSAQTLSYEQNVRLHERLGIALASIDQGSKAEVVFEKLVAMAPGFVLSYKYAPKVTFAFERARQRQRSNGAPNIQLNWPSGVSVHEPLPVSVEVLNDPLGAAKGASLVLRRDGGQVTQLPFPLKGRTAIEIPPAPKSLKKNSTLEFYVLAKDAANNEIYRIGAPNSPRRAVTLYVEPRRWYEQWYWWAAAGVVLAGAAGTTAFLLTDEPPQNVPVTGQ